MARKPPPKYPNRNRALMRRLLSQGFLLLLLLGGIVFYFYIHSSDEDGKGTLQRFGESLPVTPRRPADPPRADPPPSRQQPDAPLTRGSRPQPMPPAERSDSLPATNPAQAPAAPSPAVSPPFAGKSLSQVAEGLARSAAGRAPSAWGERLPGITTRLFPKDAAPTGAPVIALTFDACGGKKGASYDAGLIALLREQQIPATLFVTSLWLRTNPDILRELAADPLFEIAAHGARHRPCSVNGNSAYGIKGTASFAELAAEVEGNARDLEAATGKRPRWFRSGTAYYDDVAVTAIQELGLGIAGYSVTGDEGATLGAAKVAAKTLGASHGAIFLFHMNKPGSGTREGLRNALPKLKEQGFVFVRLSDVPSPLP